MKELINENDNTMTKTLNENINENFKEFQTTLMKTVEDMIAKQLSIINLNMINTIQGTLTHHTLQNTNQEGIQGPANNISQSPLTQPPTLEDSIDNESTLAEPGNQVGTIKKVTPNAKRKQDNQLEPDQTQDTTTEELNDTIMEDQSPITTPNQRTQTRLSSSKRRETRKKNPLASSTLSRLGDGPGLGGTLLVGL